MELYIKRKELASYYVNSSKLHYLGAHNICYVRLGTENPIYINTYSPAAALNLKM